MKSEHARLVGSLLLFFIPFQVHAQSGSWIRTGALTIARGAHTATLLLDGRVLVVGGIIEFSRSTEVYDVASGMWTPTESLATGRAYHTATVLNDGRVLVTGGWDGQYGSLASAELYDPDSGGWTSTRNLIIGRSSHTATLLNDGRVLVVGGAVYPGNNRASATAELYDAKTGTFSQAAPMILSRSHHTATLLKDGRVLVAGAGTGREMAEYMIRRVKIGTRPEA